MKKTWLVLIAIILTSLVAGIVTAAKVPTPEVPPEGVKVISAEEVNDLLNQKNVYVFDVREVIKYGKGHLPGAVSLPYEWIKSDKAGKQFENRIDISKLPADKNAIIVFHDHDPYGWRSYYASKVAKEAGYKNIMWLRDGFSSWIEKGYAVEH